MDNALTRLDMLMAMVDPGKTKEVMMEFLKCDMTEEAKELLERLENELYDPQTDLLLRSFANIVPYNYLVKGLRYDLDLCYKEDEDCIEGLNKIKAEVPAKEHPMIEEYIQFVESEEGELSENSNPDIDLGSLVSDISVELYPDLYNCIDYINYLIGE